MADQKINVTVGEMRVGDLVLVRDDRTVRVQNAVDASVFLV